MVAVFQTRCRKTTNKRTPPPSPFVLPSSLFSVVLFSKSFTIRIVYFKYVHAKRTYFTLTPISFILSFVSFKRHAMRYRHLFGDMKRGICRCCHCPANPLPKTVCFNKRMSHVAIFHFDASEIQRLRVPHTLFKIALVIDKNVTCSRNTCSLPLNDHAIYYFYHLFQA